MFNFIRELLKHRRETITLYIYNQDQLNKYINNGVFNSDGYSVSFKFDVEGDFDIYARDIRTEKSIKVNNITCRDLYSYNNISVKNITASGYIKVFGYEGNLTAENITTGKDIKIEGSLKANDVVVLESWGFDVRQADIGNLDMNLGKVVSYDWPDEDEDKVNFRANNVVGVTSFNVTNAIVNNLDVIYDINCENIVANDIKAKRIFIGDKLEAKDIRAKVIGDSKTHGNIVARDISAREIRAASLTARDIEIEDDYDWDVDFSFFIKTYALKARIVGVMGGDISASTIDVSKSIYARNIHSESISAKHVSYSETCIALQSFRCSSLSEGRVPACCVENDIEIKES